MSPIALFLLFAVLPISIFIFVAFFNKDKKETIIADEELPVSISDSEQPEDELNPNQFIVSVVLVKKVRGKICSTIATMLTIFIWGMIQFGLLDAELSLVDAIRSGFITNPVNLIGIAALVSSIGWWFNDPSCMLLSGIALVGAFIFDFSAWFVLIPAVLFAIASKRLVPEYSLKTTQKTDITG